MIGSKFVRALIVIGAVSSSLSVMAETNDECIARWRTFFANCVENSKNIADPREARIQEINCHVALNNGLLTCPIPPPLDPLPPDYAPPTNRADCMAAANNFVAQCRAAAAHTHADALTACTTAADAAKCQEKADKAYNDQVDGCEKAGLLGKAACPQE